MARVFHHFKVGVCDTFMQGFGILERHHSIVGTAHDQRPDLYFPKPIRDIERIGCEEIVVQNSWLCRRHPLRG